MRLEKNHHEEEALRLALFLRSCRDGCVWDVNGVCPRQETKHPRNLGRRCRAIQHLGLHPGDDGLPDTQHRPYRKGGYALH